jgi:hypothetical protein
MKYMEIKPITTRPKDILNIRTILFLNVIFFNSTFKKFCEVVGSVVMSTVVSLKNCIKNKSTGMLHATGTAI